MNPIPRTFEEQVIQDLATINTKLDDFLGEDGRMKVAEKKLEKIIYVIGTALLVTVAFIGPKAISFLVHFMP